MEYKLCALIPTYNHYAQLPGIVQRLSQAGLAVFIVDDGSHAPAQAALKTLENVQILRLPDNQGKGAAMMAGFQWVSELCYTHAFQIDADGQHSLDDLEAFIELFKTHPLALISGKPVYDHSIPLGRKIGRWLTHVWVWVETLSFKISDSMCGFRIYPVQATLACIHQSSIGKRMDFDTEIMVRLLWAGTPVLMHPVKVAYPEGNHSNFDVLRDNWLITKMHAKLVFTMLRRKQHKVDWADLSERGTILGLILLAACYKLLGRRACSVIGAPVVLYFYLTGSKQRQASTDFLNRVFKVQPTLLDGWKHFMSFFQMCLDKFAAWGGYVKFDNLEFDNPEYIHSVMSSPKGGVMFVSHLGNMEFCRGVMKEEQKKRMHILMHSKNARLFNRMMAYFNPNTPLNVIEVTEIGADTILFLKEQVEKGDWVVIAADRTPVSKNPRLVFAPFLGAEAPFSQGPYILASLLQCPVYTATAVRAGPKYKVSIQLFAQEIVLPRGRKEASIQQYAHQYARYLERYCIKYPYQWYNFYDFWIVPGIIY